MQISRYIYDRFTQIPVICRIERPKALKFQEQQKNIPKPIETKSVLCSPPSLWKIDVFGGRLFRDVRLFRKYRTWL